jgi:Na+-transporting NADH:ubiquinone oxidoreductase subunit C
LLFAAVLGGICATLLALTARWTAPLREQNRRAEHLRHVLRVLEIDFPSGAEADRLVRIFERNVTVQRRNGQVLYWRMVDGQPTAVAGEFAGRGLWGPIHGLIALEADLATIRAVTFFDHEETPGLGGEISSLHFRNQFADKRVLDSTGQVRLIIQPASTEAAGPNEVDGLTGATKTTRRVEAMLNDAIRRIRREARR